MSAVDQKNYPETMAAIYLTNAPWIFTTIFKMLQVLFLASVLWWG